MLTVDLLLVVVGIGSLAFWLYSKAHLDAMLLIVVGTCLTSFSMLITGGDTAQVGRLMLFGVAAMAIGFHGRVHIGSVPRAQSHPNEPVSLTGLNFAVVGAVVLAAYHYAVAGVPLFSSSIEVDRFDFTSSGLGGLPGRMLIFGVPLSWVLVTAASVQLKTRMTEIPVWRWCTGFYLVFAALSGFKSAIVGALVTFLLAGSVVTGVRPRIREAVRRYSAAALVSFFYLWVVAAVLYPSYRDSEGGIAGALVDRLTVVSAEPKILAIAGVTDLGTLPVLGDLNYFARKYTGQSTAGLFTTERAISAEIIGVDPASSAWTTPVTVGGVPELILNLGADLAVAVSLGIGILIGDLYVRPPGSFVGTFTRGSCVLMIYTWLSRGGLAYYTINYAVVSVAIWLLYLLGRWSGGIGSSDHSTKLISSRRGMAIKDGVRS